MLPPLIRRVLSVALGVVLVAGVAGCGPSGEKTSEGAEKLDSPVKIQHRFGTTTVESVPKRVVTIDLQWTDVMLSMGVKPVGHSIDSLMPKSGVPWQELPSGAKGLSLDDGVPVEQIAALKPDLIVGTYSIGDKETYDQLSAVAPTIPSAKNNTFVTPWQDLVETAGKVLGDQEKAKQVVDSVDAKVAATAKDLPGLKGKTFLLAQYIVGDQVTIVADEKDGSSVFFQQLGMKLYPPVTKEGKKSGDARISVSTERADLLRSDLLAFLINGGDRSDLKDIPGFDDLPGTVAVLDYPTVVGLNTPSPLSIPYGLTKLRPYLEKTAASKS